MDNHNSQHATSSVPSQLRRLKNLKQQLPVLPKVTPASSHVDQNIPVHASNKDMVGISTTREPISSSKLPIKPETQGKTDKVIPSVINENEKSFKFPIAESIEIYCYTCDSTAKGEEILRHLYFGPLKCEHCITVLSTCNRFSCVYYAKDKCVFSRNGLHSFTSWLKVPYFYIQYSTRKDVVIKSYCYDSKSPLGLSELDKLTQDYIKTISVLTSHHPWKLAFNDSQELIGYKGLLTEGDTLGSNCSKSVGNSLTQEQKSVLMYSKVECPRARTYTPEELFRSNKRVKFSQCSKSDQGDTTGQANKIGSIPKISDKILHVSQSSKSVGNSLISAQKNVNVLENSVDANPLAGSNNQKELKRSNNHMIGNQGNKSDFAQHGDGRCLVVQHPGEKCPGKCPECHCRLRISGLTFDCSTYTTKVLCPDCAFPIYIKLDGKTKLVFEKSLLLQTATM